MGLSKMQTLIQRDIKHIWHACSQMKDYEQFSPIPIVRAKGCLLYTQDDRPIIDAISSWWCKSLGHQHPRLKKALLKQLDRFEHIIQANTVNDVQVELAEKLSTLTPSLNKLLFASDGSCAIEVAMKLSIHSRLIGGQLQRTRFAALSNGYHGETVGALAVSDCEVYRQAYQSLLPDVFFIRDLPYVSGTDDPLWRDCSEHWSIIETQLNEKADQLTAIILEPIVQGAGGMLIYSQDLLRRLRAWTKQRGIHLIADEIMTGLGRTGLPLACQYAEIEPDMLCLSKGLTSGWLPLSVTLLTDELYDCFYADYSEGRNFLHSHTYSGNALAVAVALETLQVLEDDKIMGHVQKTVAPLLRSEMQRVAKATGRLTRIRSLGAVVAADLTADANERLGYQVFQKAIERGAWLRPLGNTLYWLPPLIITPEEIRTLSAITESAINAI